MKWTAAAAVVLLTALQVPVRADGPESAALLARGPVERHHYVMNARVRPLLFWISRDNVGDAVIAKARPADGEAYALLIGSDPERAPRRINRWGYIEEEVNAGRARLVGLMTESDEESVSQAEANLRTQNRPRTFKAIHGAVMDGEARSVVTSVATADDYSFRHVDTLLDLANRETPGKQRVVPIDAATRPGFLVAVADVMHQQATAWRSSRQLPRSEPVRYVYHGRLYRLAVMQSRALPTMRLGEVSYEHVITSQFRIENLQDGGVTEFSMSYAADGRLAEIPLAVTYRPRWWLEVQLALDDTTPGPRLAKALEP